MAYQYPQPPPNGQNVEMPQAEYHQAYGVPPPLAGTGHHQAPMMPVRGHDDPGQTLRRSFSMPNTGPLQNPESEQAQLAAQVDKKRNKLGYHRTSIACSHCRRRKIRCIPSTDTQTTCQNCIRLKKECSFHPVDQQPSPDARPKGSSRASTSTKAVSSGSSSPAISSGHPGDIPPQQHFPNMPLPPAVGVLPSNAHQAPGEEFSEAKTPWSGQPLSRPFEYGSQPAAPWAHSDVGPNEVSRPENLSNTWRSYPAESPMSAQFSPYSQGPPPPSATWTTGSSEMGSREEMPFNFPPPVRSMSYSGEGMGSHQQDQYLAMSQGRPYDRRPSNYSNMYSAPMGASLSGMATGTPTMDHTATLPPGILPSQIPRGWQGQPQLQRHDSYPRPSGEFAPVGYGQGGSSHEMQPSGQDLTGPGPQGQKRTY